MQLSVLVARLDQRLLGSAARVLGASSRDVLGMKVLYTRCSLETPTRLVSSILYVIDVCGLLEPSPRARNRVSSFVRVVEYYLSQYPSTC